MSRKSAYKDVQILVVCDKSRENLAYAINRAFGLENPDNICRGYTVPERNLFTVQDGNRKFLVHIFEVDAKEPSPIVRCARNVVLCTPRAIQLSEYYSSIGLQLFSEVSAKSVEELEKNPQVFQDDIRKILRKYIR